MTNSKVYTCTMHRGVNSDKPGNCPKCRMQLVPRQGKQIRNSILKPVNYAA